MSVNAKLQPEVQSWIQLSLLPHGIEGNLEANLIYSLIVTRVLMEFAMKHCSCAS